MVPIKVIRRPWGACWMVAEGGEGENPLGGGGGGGGGVRGGIPASFPSRSPPPKQPFRLRQAPTNRNLRGLGGFCGEKAPGSWWAGPQALGARAPSPLETWPTGPWGLDPATLTGSPSFWGPGQQAALHPSRVKNSKNAQVWLVAPIDFLRTVPAA